MNEPIIRCRNLSKSFIKRDVIVGAICNITLEIHQGEFTVLMGNSGAGKTTLLRLLGGTASFSGGEIWFDGRQMSGSGIKDEQMSLLQRKNVGFVRRSFNLEPDPSLLENILSERYFGDAIKIQIEFIVRELLETMGLKKLTARLPAQVSSGEQHWASTVLFMDEPTLYLDCDGSMRSLEYFEELSRQNLTMLMSTHDLSVACISDRVLFLRDGLIQGDYRFPAESLTFEQRKDALFDWLKKRGWDGCYPPNTRPPRVTIPQNHETGQ